MGSIRKVITDIIMVVFDLQAKGLDYSLYTYVSEKKRNSRALEYL